MTAPAPQPHPATATLGVCPQGASPETLFWRAKSLERAKRINELERVVSNLRDGLEEALAENVRLHEEMNS